MTREEIEALVAEADRRVTPELLSEVPLSERSRARVKELRRQKYNPNTGCVTFDYQVLPRRPEGKLKQEKFCRSCGEHLPARKNPVGIQFFYCQPNCAFEASLHAATKGYASPEYVKARRNYVAAKKIADADCCLGLSPYDCATVPTRQCDGNNEGSTEQQTQIADHQSGEGPAT